VSSDGALARYQVFMADIRRTIAVIIAAVLTVICMSYLVIHVAGLHRVIGVATVLVPSSAVVAVRAFRRRRRGLDPEAAAFVNDSDDRSG
jgi:hypothetical protein